MFEYSKKHKLTFKNDERSSGLASVGQMIGCDIKYRKKHIGRVHRNSLHAQDAGKYTVGFSVNKPEDGQWSWVYFKTKFDTMDEARAWATSMFETILESFTSKGWTIHEIDY